MRAICFFVLACCGVLTACAGNAPPTMAQTNVGKPVRQKFTAFNKHDIPAIESTYAIDAALHSPDNPHLRGNGPIASTYRELFAAIPDAKDDLKSFDVIGDRVYVQFVLEGHWGGAADKALRVPIISVYTVKGDHIVDDATYYDRKAR